MSKFKWTEGRVAIMEVILQSDRALRTRDIRRLADYECSDNTLQWVLREMHRAGVIERLGRSHSYCYLSTERGRRMFELFDKGAIAS